MTLQEAQTQGRNPNFVAPRRDIRVRCRLTPAQYAAVRDALITQFPTMDGTCQTVNAWQSKQLRIMPIGGHDLPDGLTLDAAEDAVAAAVEDNPVPMPGEQPWHMMQRRKFARRR